MKWIGLHIWDFISRFRADVYLEESDLTSESSVAGKPLVTLKTTNTTKTSSAELQFKKDAADTEDGEYLGKITFYGEDEGNNNTQFAEIIGLISESDEGDESGKVSIRVGSDGNLRNFIEGSGSSSDIVDVSIGYGANSTTTILGDLYFSADSVDILSENFLDIRTKGNLGFVIDYDNNSTSTDFFWCTNGASHTSTKLMNLSDDALLTVGGAGSGGTGNITIQNLVNDATGPMLRFLSQRGTTAADGQDDDILGQINFYGYDDGTPSAQSYANIKGTIADATSGQEAGKLELQVAEYDGTVTTGLTLDGNTDADGEIDVTIGAGAASRVNVPGELVVTTSATFPKRKFTKTADGTHFECQGDVLYLGTGSTTQGDLCYLKEDGSWGQADADGAATGDDADRDAMGMLAIALGTDPDADGMLIRGIITMDYDLGDTANPIYVSTTAGAMTATAPTARGDFVRVVGYCLDDTNGQMYFNPDNTWVEIA